MPSPQVLSRLIELLDQGKLSDAREMASRLHREASGQQQLTAEVLHEVRQPLLGIKAYAQFLSEGADPAQVSQQILRQAERIEAIVGDYTRLASNRPAHREPLVLSEPVRRAVEFLRSQPAHAALQLDAELASELEIIGNARLIEQLTLNLIANAAEAMGGEGRILVRVSRDEGVPVLDVGDWGPGIPADQAQAIFEPYVTGNTRASGLGLAVCQRIAADHGAELTLAPPTVMGGAHPPSTVFRLRFPDESTVHQRRRLLVVDDESILRQIFVDLMGRECEVVTAETAEEALEHLAGEGFDLIVTDKNLPGMNGLELAREARKRDAHSRVILMTGYPSLVTAQEAMELGVLDYLLKPFDDIREVRELLRQQLAAPRPDPVSARSLKRVDVLESDPDAAFLIEEALRLLGMETRVVREVETPIEPAPAAVVVSWEFEPAQGSRAVALARQTARGAPFIVLAEHLSLDCTLESLKGGATACLPKLTRDARVLSRELARAMVRTRD